MTVESFSATVFIMKKEWSAKVWNSWNPLLSFISQALRKKESLFTNQRISLK